MTPNLHRRIIRVAHLLADLQLRAAAVFIILLILDRQHLRKKLYFGSQTEKYIILQEIVRLWEDQKQFIVEPLKKVVSQDRVKVVIKTYRVLICNKHRTK